MSGIYNEEHRLFQESIRRFSEREILPHINSWEEKFEFPNEIFLKLGQAGFLGILIDEKFGGVNGDYILASAWCEEFGRVPAVGFTTAINMHSLVITPTLQKFGTEEAKNYWLSKAVEGKAIGAYAFTEPGAGSDLTQVSTRATKDGNDFVLNGSKTFITNGARANFILVLAKTSNEPGYKGFTTFVVDTTSPGFSVTRKLSKLGWHSSDTAELSFQNVRVSHEMILGEIGQGWLQAMQSLQWERLMLALNALAGARECLRQTIQYVNERKVFGRTVGSYDNSRQLLSSLWAELESGRALTHKALRLLVAGEECRKESSLAKYNVCELATRVADRCLQLHGGYGYTTEFLPERWLRDLRLNTIGGGTSEIMLRIAAKEEFPNLNLE